ncbi:hypothetical protein AB1N83_014250 [Pleurotus pulmonarius]
MSTSNSPGGFGRLPRSDPLYSFPRGNISPQHSRRDIHNGHNTNSASGTFNQVAGNQYNITGIPRIEVLTVFTPGIATASVGQYMAEASLPRQDSNSSRTTLEELRARKRDLQAEIDSMMDRMGWNEQQRLEQRISDLQMRKRTLQQIISSEAGLDPATEDQEGGGGEEEEEEKETRKSV